MTNQQNQSTKQISSEANWYLEYFSKNQDSLMKTFFEFLSFKSISTEPEYQSELTDCVNWLQQILHKLGFSTEVWETSRHPVLFASRLDAGPDKPTVLIYNHYDVQPVDPLELWESPPFEPTIRDGEVFARGAQDNKGQCFFVISALAALLEKNGKLPVNVKLCIEGEEEAGSKGLLETLAAKKSQLQADYLAVVDMGINSVHEPAVTTGLRGITHIQIELVGSKTDLHSGIYGGIAFNPLHALVEMLAKCRDSEGRVTIPGFYDGIVEPKKEEIEKLNLNFDLDEYMETVGHEPTGGEKNCSPLISNWLRPTLEINGIGGGYFGTGFKTVIPARALAKLSARLVPNQDASHIANCMISYLKSLTPAGVELIVSDVVTTGGAIRTSPNSRGIQATAQAYEEVCGKPCGYILSGGSIPVISELSKVAGAEPVMFGYGLATDNMHAPNEHFGIDRLAKGLATVARVLEILSK